MKWQNKTTNEKDKLFQLFVVASCYEAIRMTHAPNRIVIVSCIDFSFSFFLSCSFVYFICIFRLVLDIRPAFHSGLNVWNDRQQAANRKKMMENLMKIKSPQRPQTTCNQHLHNCNVHDQAKWHLLQHFVSAMFPFLFYERNVVNKSACVCQRQTSNTFLFCFTFCNDANTTVSVEIYLFTDFF